MKYGLGWMIAGVFLWAPACEDEKPTRAPTNEPVVAPSVRSPASDAPAKTVEKPAAVEAASAADPKPKFKLKMESITAIPKAGTVTGTVTKVEPAPADPNSKGDQPKVKVKGLTIQAE